MNIDRAQIQAMGMGGRTRTDPVQAVDHDAIKAMVEDGRTIKRSATSATCSRSDCPRP